MLEDAGVVLHCLGVTKDGDPLHPLKARRGPAPGPVPVAGGRVIV